MPMQVRNKERRLTAKIFLSEKRLSHLQNRFGHNYVFDIIGCKGSSNCMKYNGVNRKQVFIGINE